MRRRWKQWIDQLRRPGRWRLWLSLSLLAGAALAVAVAAVVAELALTTGWAMAAIAVAAAAGLFVPALIGLVRQQGSGQQALLRMHCWMDEATGWLPRIKDLNDPVELGVYPAARLPATDSGEERADLPIRVPVYIPRDLDDPLDEALSQGGLVLIRGDSTAGKSRVAYEAIHRAPLHDRWLLVPHHRQSLRALLDGGVEIRDTVVWLNDLERYLGADGLDVGLLRRLLGDPGRRVVVLATMRAHEYARRSPDRERDIKGAERDLLRAERELLDQATDLELLRRFSEDEGHRAEERDFDPRIADALAHSEEHELVEYVAAAPRLWRRWRDGFTTTGPDEARVGAALVAAAVDCRRAGLTRPVPQALMEKLYPLYLEGSITQRLTAELVEQGLRWATTEVHATSALFTPHGDAFAAFVYLLDELQTDPTAAGVPEQLWVNLMAHLRVDDGFGVANAAYQAGLLDVTEQAIRRVADAGIADAQYNLGNLLQRRGDNEEATHWWRLAANAGHTVAQVTLGEQLAIRGDDEEAEHWWRQAADGGHTAAQVILGVQLRDRNDEEAEHWWRLAADAGHTGARGQLGVLLHKRGDDEEAEHWWRLAANAGHLDAQINLGILLRQRGDHEEAERWLRLAADAGP